MKISILNHIWAYKKGDIVNIHIIAFITFYKKLSSPFSCFPLSFVRYSDIQNCFIHVIIDIFQAMSIFRILCEVSKIISYCGSIL